MKTKIRNFIEYIKNHKNADIIFAFIVLGLVMTVSIIYFASQPEKFPKHIKEVFQPITPKEEIKIKSAPYGNFKDCEELSSFFSKHRDSAYSQLFEMEKTLPESEEEADRGGGGMGGGDYSTTNVQIEGIDEGDTVKTDGEYIYLINDGDIIISKAYPASQAKILKTIVLTEDKKPEDDYYDYYGEGASEIYLDNNRLIAVGYKRSEVKTIANLPEWYKNYKHYTFVKVWDITDKTNPKIVKDIKYEGSYNTSRKIGDKLYFVINTYPDFWTIPKDASGQEIIPKFFESNTNADTADSKPSCSCKDLSYFGSVKDYYKNINSNDYRSNFISILELSLDHLNDRSRTKVIIGNSETVFSSLENMYITSQNYSYNYQNNPINTTDIHKFNLTNLDYLKTTEVKGSINDKYSMDEFENNLRVATTVTTYQDNTPKETNSLFVYDKNLNLIGSLENLAEGERIYAVRFSKNRGYIVTFKEVDPLFVIDLKNPNKPTVLGYLKVPGYSNYLHPYDENHIIGIGKNATETRQNFAWYQGIKMALFDITDFKKPKEMFKTEIGDRGTDSVALNDPKAFLFSKSKNLLALPILLAELTPEQKTKKNNQSEYGEYKFQGAYVYNLNLSSGFSLRGKVTHFPNDKLTLTHQGGNYYDFDHDYEIHRVLYIEDNLYTISNNKIKINDIKTMNSLGEISLR